jgi:CHAT domain-containing protein
MFDISMIVIGGETDAPTLFLALLLLCVACNSRPGAALVRELDHEVPRAPRLIEARLSLGSQTPRGASVASVESPNPRILDLAGRASDYIRASADPDALRASALIDLLWSPDEGNSVSRSISQLSMATRLTNDAAPALSDLAAVYLIRESSDHSTRDLLESIDASSRALQFDRAYAPARFNLALALDRLGLADQASRAWTAYLTFDSSSAWAAVARAKLRAPVRIDPPAPDESPERMAAYAEAEPQGASLLGWDQLLGRWGQAVVGGDSAQAERWLDRTDAVGGALVRHGGDACLADAVRTIRDRSYSAPALHRLAAAHAAYSSARATYLSADYASASLAFDHVRRVAESPCLRDWASVFYGATLMYARRTADAERELRAVIARVDARRYPALAGRARWVYGTTLVRSKHEAAAFVAYQSAEPEFSRSHEWENLGAMQFLSAEAASLIGRPTAYSAMHASLKTLSQFRGSVWLHDVLHVWSQTLANDGFVSAAEHLQDEDIGVATKTGRPFLVAEARIARARLLAGIGARFDAADVDSSARIVSALPQSYERQWLETDLKLLEAERIAHSDPAAAASALDSVIAYFLTVNGQVRLVPAYLLRSESRVALGDTAGSAKDIDNVFAILNGTRNVADSLPLPRMLASRAQAVVDRLLLDRARTGSPTVALAALDRWRGAGPVARPPGSVAVTYGLIADTLLAFTVSDTAVRLTRTILPSNRLRTTVDHVNTALELRTNERAIRPDLAQLHDWLIAPIHALLGARGALVDISVSGVLAAVPFAALYDPGHDQYLVEEHPLRFAPSVRTARPPGRTTGEDSTAVLVADPAFARDQFPQLEPLPGAAAEVRGIAMEYRAPITLAGPAATQPAIEDALQRVTVVHYAGHAIADDDRPGRSALVLATGALSAATIEQLDLHRLRLVVLSACQTARTSGTYGDGFDGLAGAFLKAGAGGVIGSLWPVSDRSTTPLMIELHRAYRSSGNGPRALREAQLHLLHSTDSTLRSPAAWAAFRYLGN